MPSDSLGPDGFVRLRCYLPATNTMWFAGSCSGCSRSVTIGIEAAIDLMGSADATVGELAARLRCRPCGRRISLQVMADSRSPEARRDEGRLPETEGMRVWE
jgi:hypothetical protein